MFGQGNPESRELVADCDAFLEGRFVEHLSADGAAVPVWTWTNLLAHGTEDDLRAPPHTIPRLPRILEPWVEARAFLAGEVLDVVARGVPLLTVQREALIPLELEFASRPPDHDFGPVEWVDRVQRAMAPRLAKLRRRRG